MVSKTSRIWRWMKRPHFRASRTQEPSWTPEQAAVTCPCQESSPSNNQNRNPTQDATYIYHSLGVSTGEPTIVGDLTVDEKKAFLSRLPADVFLAIVDTIDCTDDIRSLRRVCKSFRGLICSPTLTITFKWPSRVPSERFSGLLNGNLDPEIRGRLAETRELYISIPHTPSPEIYERNGDGMEATAGMIEFIETLVRPLLASTPKLTRVRLDAQPEGDRGTMLYIVQYAFKEILDICLSRSPELHLILCLRCDPYAEQPAATWQATSRHDVIPAIFARGDEPGPNWSNCWGQQVFKPVGWSSSHSKVFVFQLASMRDSNANLLEQLFWVRKFSPGIMFIGWNRWSVILNIGPHLGYVLSTYAKMFDRFCCVGMDTGARVVPKQDV